VDHASGKIFNLPQYSSTALETIKSSLWLEVMAWEEGFWIKGYHSDKGIFASPEFKNHCAQHNQSILLVGLALNTRTKLLKETSRQLPNRHAPTCFTWQPICPNMPTQNTGLKQLTMRYGCSTDFQIWNLE
jgi:hypothetical protein